MSESRWSAVSLGKQLAELGQRRAPEPKETTMTDFPSALEQLGVRFEPRSAKADLMADMLDAPKPEPSNRARVWHPTDDLGNGFWEEVDDGMDTA